MSTATSQNVSSWEELILEVCKDIEVKTGNILSEKQFPMVESRLKRRVLEMGFSGPEEYLSYLKENKLEETKYLVGLLTTHMTSFFREKPHFEWLAKELPQAIERARSEGRTSLRIWSAACSRGHEVWSLAMWMNHYMSRIAPDFGWEIVGSDIDEQCLKEARNGVYHSKEIDPIPHELTLGLWQRGKGEISQWYRVGPKLRSRVKFFYMNLLEPNLNRNECFDFIFCRNVLIYFGQDTLKKVISTLLNQLYPGGILITGLSESLSGQTFPLRALAPSIYKLKVKSL